MSLRWIPVAALVMFTLPGAPSSAETAQMAPATAVAVEILPIDFESGQLSGPGGERLRDELADVHFIALGEDHGFAGPPRLAAALASAANTVPGAAPLVHAIEVGPHTARWSVAILAEGGVAALDRALVGRPYAMPFLANAEDAELAQTFAAQERLWGIDQEFIASPVVLFDMLVARSGDAALHARLRTMQQADREALAAGRFNDLLLSTMTAADFAALAEPFAGDPEALAIIAALADSAAIYQLNNAGRYLENNEVRAALMQRYFLTQWRGGPDPMPRVLFKMGAFHMGRGTTPTNIYDIGSLLPGLAAGRGSRSLHIAYIPLAGSVRQIRPGPDSFTTVSEYDGQMVTPLLAAAGIDPQSLPATGHVLMPLANLRHSITGAAMRALDTQARFLLLGFDYLVTTRAATPATHLESN